MGKTILFSPVGGTDPISENNLHDGSLLHICRYYRPDDVILYMSGEILEKHKKDNRYIYCLDRLAEMQGRKMDYHVIERPDLHNVQDFNFFYEDFRNIIDDIFRNDLDEDDRLIFNISSGTPAMKSGIAVLQTIEEYPGELVQVVTPVKKMNEHTHREDDMETLWGLDLDNEPDAENRCQVIHVPALSVITQMNIIKRHMRAYDYKAALDVADSIRAYPGVSDWLPLIEIADARRQLDESTVDRLSRKTGFDCIPVKDGTGKKYFEYALDLQAKLESHQYADFIRGITPLIADLYELALKRSCGIDVEDYTYYDKKDKKRKWEKGKLAGTDVLHCIEEAYKDRNGGFKCGVINSDNLLYLIYEFSSDLDLKRTAEDLRDVEVRIRNLAAHEIVSITEDSIRKKTAVRENKGFTAGQIMQMIRKMVGYAGIKASKDDWRSYDHMNEMIIDRMD